LIIEKLRLQLRNFAEEMAEPANETPEASANIGFLGWHLQIDKDG
jgi:hypothetical protein